MNKKKLAKSVVGIALIVSVAILIVVCVGKIKHIQNKKNIIGTWKNANAEEVFTFQENGGLVVNKDMPELCKFRFIGSPIPLATDQCFRL